MADTGKRDAMLGRIRRAVSTGDDAARRAVVAERIKTHNRNLIPQRSQVSHDKQIELFRAQAEAVHATVVRVDTPDDIPEAVSAFLRNHNLPQQLRHGEDPLLNALPWKEKAPTVDIGKGKAQPADDVSVSHAVAGVAESGTLVLTSGPDNPTTLNFMPENHIVVLETKDVCGTYEDAWTRIREIHGERQMPRTVNMVSGPSRTGDIAQTLYLGAHGPRRLHIVIVG